MDFVTVPMRCVRSRDNNFEFQKIPTIGHPGRSLKRIDTPDSADDKHIARNGE